MNNIPTEVLNYLGLENQKIELKKKLEEIEKNQKILKVQTLLWLENQEKKSLEIPQELSQHFTFIKNIKMQKKHNRESINNTYIQKKSQDYWYIILKNAGFVDEQIQEMIQCFVSFIIHERTILPAQYTISSSSSSSSKSNPKKKKIT